MLGNVSGDEMMGLREDIRGSSVKVRCRECEVILRKEAFFFFFFNLDTLSFDLIAFCA